MNTPICWFEIPTTDLDRATTFYEAAFAIALRRDSCGGHPMALFPYAEPNPGGALVAMPEMAPCDNGTLIYLNGGDDLSNVLKRIPAAGGKVVMEKTCIGEEIGHIALFIDSEGNRVGLFSPR